MPLCVWQNSNVAISWALIDWLAPPRGYCHSHARVLLCSRSDRSNLTHTKQCRVRFVHTCVCWSDFVLRDFLCRDGRSVGKANEALTRIGMGLAANPSVTESEMLLYVHATVAPFLLPQVGFLESCAHFFFH